MVLAQIRALQNAGSLKGSRIKVHAAMGSGYTGGFAWARVGYNSTFGEKASPLGGRATKVECNLPLMRDKMLRELGKIHKDLHSLMSTPEGVEFWRNNATWFYGDFDPKPGSAGRTVLDTYLKYKMANRKDIKESALQSYLDLLDEAKKIRKPSSGKKAGPDGEQGFPMDDDDERCFALAWAALAKRKAAAYQASQSKGKAKKKKKK